jgi:hypothetical protein
VSDVRPVHVIGARFGLGGRCTGTADGRGLPLHAIAAM